MAQVLAVPPTSNGWVNMEQLIGGHWSAATSGREEDVISPFDGAVVGSVPMAGRTDVDAALTAAVAGARVWRNTPGHERMRIFLSAATLADERVASRTSQRRRLRRARSPSRHPRDRLGKNASDFSGGGRAFRA